MALSKLIDLASERVGGAVVAANDEAFASRENLVLATEPVEKDLYIPSGKWMDGWETRRRREPGHDWCIVRLGIRGVARSVVVDTAFFRGNYPEHCSLEGLDIGGQPSPQELAEDSNWFEMVPRSALQGNHKNMFAVPGERPVTHVRLRIYPDGGVARLRVLGDAVPDWDRVDFTGELVDLAAVEYDGRVVECSDMFFSDAQNMLMPGLSVDMSDGWETRRRRDAGNDWSIIRLGTVGRITRVVLETHHFKSNAPGACSIEVRNDPDSPIDEIRDAAGWMTLLPRTPLRPHAKHWFQDELELCGPISHARLSIYPDGGVARLRLWGRSERGERLLVAVGEKNALSKDALAGELLQVCKSPLWAERFAKMRPFPDFTTLLAASDRAWRQAGPDAWKQAFAGHPRIGDTSGGKWSRQEQAGASDASAAVLTALAEGNAAYEKKFGHIFLTCATGKSAQHMLAELETRMGNSPEQELAVAAEEQRKITRLRLVKWLLNGH